MPALFAFLGDKAAMRHTHVDATPRDCRRRIAAHAWRGRRDGFAPWTVATRAEGAIIGWGGLYIDPADPAWGVELGYFFHPAHWGRGYARELAAAAMAQADGPLNLASVQAFAHPDNVGSRRVLAGAGFAEIRYVAGMDRLLYRRDRQ